MTSRPSQSDQTTGKGEVDLERLAEEVYKMLLWELKIERERQPVRSRPRFNTTRRSG